jgi:plastocyanin
MPMPLADLHAPRRAGGIVLAAAIVVVAVAGCGTGADLPSSSTSTQQAAADPSSAKTISVVMKNLEFSPLAVKARVGEKITWLNEDQAPHNVTYISGPAFRSSQRRLLIGQRFSITPSRAGTIRYVCTLHPWMHATISVSP